MGSLDEGPLNLDLEIGLKNGSFELPFEHQPETLAIQDAVKLLLQGLHEDVNREGIKKTPFRVAKALREGTRGYKQKVKEYVQSALFPEAGLDSGVGQAGGVGGLVVVRDLDHYSYCESCLLPFHVRCHIGYVPSEQRVLGLSKFSRVADVFAKRLQEPKRLADEICSALQHWVKPSGVAVVLQCSHIHFPSLDLVDSSSHDGFVRLMVSSGSGVFEDERSSLWGEFLSFLKFKGVKTQAEWCPSVKSKLFLEEDQEMVSAVVTILRSLGEDPSRKELIATPSRFLNWMMNFQNVNLEMKLLNGFNSVKANGDIREKRLHCELKMPFWSMCEHHLLPFYGVVHVGYYCTEGSNAIASSLLKSIVHFYGFKLQVQERMTRQIAEKLSPLVGGDVIVVAEAGHTCMISRGIEKFGSSTATIAVLGQFCNDSSARVAFLDKISTQQLPCKADSSSPI
ncbi:PREDICTED: GTP cyclohydrolase 1-like [Brassica oleracea var. oleracea]|uniref:GTP cyclohydrolase 1 n=1 Tax=Brassica oleracea var. oleracea TaxID=109376 RepID=A0A0D3AF67_BRAOL|nr:PREDICTED: GTP cyclohydrolase 1-like [Brassica oleracea var. oleracea]